MSMKTLLRSICWTVLGLLVVIAMSSLPIYAKPFPESEVHPRLSTNLQILTRQASGIRPQGDSPGSIDPDEEISVILEPSSGDAALIHDSAIRMAGGVVEARSESLIRVRVPIDRLEDLAEDVAGIVFIREPFRPVPLAVVSQGVALTGASDFHDAGFEGQGAKVAIIDLGFSGLSSAQAAGELQNVVFTHDYTGSGLETEYVHGTGVAETVEDMAPLAELYLMKISDSVDLQNAVQDCIDNGVHIINHSVGWYNSNYYDGTGVIGAIVSNARYNDILWVNSAGNEASDGHWQGDFVDTDSDGYHEFSSGSDYLDGDIRDEGSRFYATAGDTVIIYMSWDDWTFSNQDYDLFLYNSAGTEVASSLGWQTGSQSPTEAIFYDVPAFSSGYYEIVIQAYNAPQEPEIEFFAYLDSGDNTGLEHHDPTSSIITPANSADVLAVGAIRRTNWTTGPQESFSSQGPSNASKYSSSLIKPDVSGPDGTSNYTYGSFYGTSASSPHVAGAAALLLSENSGRTAEDLQTLLESSAIDMGTAGKDNIYGAGRLNLEPAPAGDTAAVFRVDSTGNVYADGSFYGAGFYTGSADVAEWVSVSEPVEPGDVLEFDPDYPNIYRKSSRACSTLVAGVVSTDPGFILGSNPFDFGPWTEDSRLATDNSALLALVGIVPVKACDENGPITLGDILVASSTPGYAMRWNPENHGFCDNFVGKALEPLESGTGIIKVLLMR